ncbi:hypothetical protein [Methylobacterium oryzihabitans]|uniref:Uncharacterized protein n=1 Tax=Methylobacterium oryzihabitans TaxID=2499852 RepID=A0A3S2YXN2_9HYPH|nr:hypothetical protein [Methylobacterium oryzihabitans]RVU21800.1 hypothetical protein EOE48_01775 [Methylobacterium oryzihabitans]
MTPLALPDPGLAVAPVPTVTSGDSGRPVRGRWRGAAVPLLAGTALLASAPVLLPRAWEAWHLRQAADDPAALSDLRLAAVPAAVLDREIDAAVAAGDSDLARSFLALAETRGVAVSAERRAAVEALDAGAAGRSARDLARGFATGEAKGAAGLAGAVAGDLVGYGDLRDLWREGGRWLRDEPYDEVLLGLSAVGLALTGVTVATLGGGAAASAPVHAGATTLKVASRTGRLSRPLAGLLARTGRTVLDPAAARAAFVAAGRLDVAALRRGLQGALRPAAFAELRGLGRSTAALQGRLGTRGALQALSVAETADDLRRAARLSERAGLRTRAILKLLGRGALVLGAGLAALVQGIAAGIAWLVGLALLCRRLGLVLGRLIWRRRR